MDVRSWLLRRTPIRPLIVTTLGGTDVRLAAERAARIRAWRPALSPAEANLLVVAGPGDPLMTPFLDSMWKQIPAPKARIHLDEPAAVETGLASGVDRVHSADEQSEAGVDTDHGGHDRIEAGTMAEHGHSQPEHEEHQSMHGTPMAHHEHAEHMAMSHDHGGHAGHDMSGMEMPGGIPMADRAPDRDELKLDQLTVPLGPGLPAWPAGLLIRAKLQGDVIQDATVKVLGDAPAGAEPFWASAKRQPARPLDSCVRLLTVAGWEDAAATAARLRDDILMEKDVQSDVTRWARRVGRSRTLRWSLTGLGLLDGPQWTDSPLEGDAYDRLMRWTSSNSTKVDPVVILDALPQLLTGAEFATARLIVASLDPDLERLRAADD
ncbi:hypothetical protein NQK81_35270 [Amycolatopsis roodepoortensis]|uniref:hypothetical protein n=1 Tax=Amycolatopsis roodepoortensis TaxID=700274 RepID=UPI00214C2411|nr:hypothetical protein [Amycolatopsis roodepoortensis]UUV29984.1 hypothetical protein NQK81_35270 [Amycolatopsis roodepoortensis]